MSAPQNSAGSYQRSYQEEPDVGRGRQGRPPLEMSPQVTITTSWPGREVGTISQTKVRRMEGMAGV